MLQCKNAYQEKKQITAYYDNYYREMCPHIIGVKDGIQHVLAYQFAGSSSKGLPTNGAWRCMEISKLRNIQIREGEWHTGSSHKKPNTCIDRIIIEVEH